MDQTNSVQLKTSPQVTIIRNPYAAANRKSILRNGSTSSYNNPPRREDASFPRDDLPSLQNIGQEIASEEKTKSPDNVTRSTTSSTSDLNYWQRLPTQTISFGSAEILSVEECITHTSLYKGRSIRTTGILQERSIQGDPATHIVLELIDPLTKSASAVVDSLRALDKRPVQSRPWIGSKNTPKQLGSGKTMLHRPIQATPKSAITTKRVGSGSGRLLVGTPFRRPFQATPLTSSKLGQKQQGSSRSICTPLGNLSQKTPTSNITPKQGFLGKRKRPRLSMASSSTKKAVPPRKLKILVDLNIPRLDQLTRGSMVMVIGIVLQSGTVQARMVQLVNNFDATFYNNSLAARRELLYRDYQNRQKKLQTSESAKEVQQCDDTGPILGCGPPPYTDFLKGTGATASS